MVLNIIKMRPKQSETSKMLNGKIVGIFLFKVIIMLLFSFSVSLSPVLAQETVTTSGGEASGINGAVSYTVGQIVYTTNFGTNGSVAQGVQQPYEISVVVGIEEAKDITLECSVYPNPTTDYLTLKVDNYELLAFDFRLYDISGKLLESKKIESHETSIVLSNFATSIYFLKVTQSNKEIKTFKIIKN